MGSDTLLIGRAEARPSWVRREGDREIAHGRPSIPAAWLALFDSSAVQIAGNDPSFVALVTSREAALARFAERKPYLCRQLSPALEHHLGPFEQALATSSELFLQVLLYDTYADWTDPIMVDVARDLIDGIASDEVEAWRSFYFQFGNDDALEDPGKAISAIVGWVSGESDPQLQKYSADEVSAVRSLRERLYAEH